MFLAFHLSTLAKNIEDDNEDVVYLTDSNGTSYLRKQPAVFLLVQQGFNERVRYFSDFVKAAPSLGTRCQFAFLDGDRNHEFVKKYHSDSTKNYYFFRYGSLIEQYAGDTDPDSLIKYTMSKTGLAFTTFEDYPDAKDFLDSHEISIILFDKFASGSLFEKFQNLAQILRDNYSFGFCPEADVTYELRIRSTPSIALFRNSDKQKAVCNLNLTSSSISDIIKWIEENKKPIFDLFKIQQQKIYMNKGPVGLFFTPVSEEKIDVIFRIMTTVAQKYQNNITFAYIDAATGNRFMQAVGFGRYADPAFVILEYNNTTYPRRFLYKENSPFMVKPLSNFIESYFKGEVEPTFKCANIPINETNNIVKEINAIQLETFITNTTNNVIILYYEDWDRIYQDFLPIYEKVASIWTSDNISFAKINVAKNDIIYGPRATGTPTVKLFHKGNIAAKKYKGKLLLEPFNSWIARRATPDIGRKESFSKLVNQSSTSFENLTTVSNDL